MKRIIQSTAAVFLLLMLTGASPLPHHARLYAGATAYRQAASPRVEFKKQWVDFDVYDGYEKGMRIHLTFTVYDLRATYCYILIVFQQKKDDKYQYITARSESFSDLWGDVMIYKKLNPCCDITDYTDLQLFMPYSELNLSSGRYDLRMDVDLSKDNMDNDSEDPAFIGHMNYYTFWYNN